MTDGIKTVPGSASDPTVDTDEVTRGGQSVHQQVVKISLGTDGVHDGLVSGASPLPIVGAVTANAGSGTFTVGDGGGSLTIDGSVSIAGAVDTELPAAAALADNTANPTTPSMGAFAHWFDGTTWDRARGDSTGGMFAQGPAAHDAAVAGSPLLMGGRAQATAPTDVTADGDVVRAWYLRNGAQVATLQSGGVLSSIRDLANANPIDVAIVDGSGNQITSFGGGTEYTEDAAAAADPVGKAAILIRQDTPAGIVSANGDNIAQRGTNFGAAFVQVVNSSGAFVDSFGGSGGTAQADESAFTEGSTNFTPIGGVLNDTITSDPTEDQAAAARITAKRAIHINLRNVGGTEIGVAAAPLRTDPTGTTAQPVTDNGGSLTVDGTVSVTGAVDTELPSAASLADGAANPTTPSVGSNTLVFNGTTWDRARGDTTNGLDVDVTRLPALVAGTANIGDVDIASFATGAITEVQGDVADDAAIAGNPVTIGLNARQTNRTAVTDGDAVRALGDDVGRQVVVLNQVRDLVTDATVTLSGTTETTVLAAGGAGVFHDVTLLVITNTSATAVRVDIRDATAGTIRLSLGIAANGGAVVPFNTPRPQTTANGNWTAQLSAAVTDVRVYMQAVKNV